MEGTNTQAANTPITQTIATNPAANPAANDHRKYAVLYVDDEEQALKYFRKGFDKEFQVMTANCVAQAMTLLEANAAKIGVVLTDQRMPNQLGVELLKQIRQRWPNIVRILITAFSDVESAIDAVNSGAIYKYITKPADLPVLKQTLRGAMELFVRQAERDELLNEKLSTLRRAAVVDRVRSLAAMAGGLSHHLRNSMTAMSCFLEEMSPPPGQPAPTMSPDANGYFKELWQLAQSERQNLLRIVQTVGNATIEPNCAPTEQDLVELVKNAAETAKKTLGEDRLLVNIEPQSIKIKLDAPMLTRLCTTLAGYASRLSGSTSKVTFSMQNEVPIWNTQGVCISITSDGPPWGERELAALFTPFAFPPKDPSDLGLELLVAFYIAYQHGGDVVIRDAKQTPGFDLLLPLNPSEVKRPDLGEGMLGEALGAVLPRAQASSATVAAA